MDPVAPDRGQGLQAGAYRPARGHLRARVRQRGFFGPATQLYHRHPPTGWIDWQGPLRPRAFDTTLIEGGDGGPWAARPLLENAHCKVRAWRQGTAMAHLARNADGDELIFVHEGAGELFCEFGHLSFRDGDYIVLPKTTTWRIEPSVPVRALLIESTNTHYTLPERGLVGEQAIFDPAILETPKINAAYEAQQDDSTWRIEIKARGQISTVTYPYNPLDTVGWQGSVMPVKLNWRDIRPLMSHRFHVPPSAHSTFMGGRFVVCTFVPRPFESDPGALKVPFFHSNNDYDEVIFYHAGEFFSRDNIHPGMLTLHPAGFPHGPHPKALANAFEQKRAATDEVAVMIDTRDPLDVSAEAEGLERCDYVDSWGAANLRRAKAAE